jgi:arylsulfatase A-like enzyme
VTTPGRTSSELVTLIDLAPTFAALAGAAAPGTEGLDLMSVLSGSGSPWRSDFLIEHRQLNDTGSGVPPSYCAVRSRTHLYVQYRTLEEELYDVALDPYQLSNLAALPSARDDLLAMRERNRQLCQPPPPGLDLIAPSAVAGGG